MNCLLSQDHAVTIQILTLKQPELHYYPFLLIHQLCPNKHQPNQEAYILLMQTLISKFEIFQKRIITFHKRNFLPIYRHTDYMKTNT